MNVNIRVLVKEPRGFCRILQILFAALAWSTVANFSTISKLRIFCPDTSPFTAEYKIDYPFDLRKTEVQSPINCSDDARVVIDKFPIDFSTISMLYVLISAISLLYAFGALFYYSVLTAKYETDPLAPTVDLGITVSILILWIILTFIWALNVSDLKHYTHPHYFKERLSVCEEGVGNCQPIDPGKWSSLTVSIVCGFLCIVLWLGSSWFIFKETSFHKKQPYTTTNTTITTQSPEITQQDQPQLQQYQ